MSLLIGLFLLIVCMSIVGKDKRASASAKRERDEKAAKQDYWESIHTNFELECSLVEYIDNKDNYESVIAEVQKAFSEMEHFNKAFLDKDIALDIMLANRGYVKFINASLGRMAYLNRINELDKYRRFELLEWIIETLNKQGIVVEASYCKFTDDYFYIGSLGESTHDTYECVPFSRELLHPKSPEIPAPYYKQ